MNETNNNNIPISGKAKKVNSNKNRKRNYCPWMTSWNNYLFNLDSQTPSRLFHELNKKHSII